MDLLLTTSTNIPNSITTWPILEQVCVVLGYIMRGIYCLLNEIGICNISVCLIFFVILARILTLPSVYNQLYSRHVVRYMTEENDLLNEKYRGIKNQYLILKYNTEKQMVMDKYGAVKGNGCLISLIQIPILMSLYGIVSSFEFFVPEARELSLAQKDRLYSLFSMDISESCNASTAGLILIGISVIGEFLFLCYPYFVDRDYKHMFSLMNIILLALTVFCYYSLPVFLCIYWIVFVFTSVFIYALIDLKLHNKDVEYYKNINLKKLNKNRKMRQLDNLSKMPTIES